MHKGQPVIYIGPDQDQDISPTSRPRVLRYGHPGRIYTDESMKQHIMVAWVCLEDDWISIVVGFGVRPRSHDPDGERFADGLSAISELEYSRLERDYRARYCQDSSY